jgi:hypothetical protein
VRTIFQRADTFVAVIRATFDGSTPLVSAEKPKSARPPMVHPDGYGDDDWPPRESMDYFSGI